MVCITGISEYTKILLKSICTITKNAVNVMLQMNILIIKDKILLYVPESFLCMKIVHSQVTIIRC